MIIVYTNSKGSGDWVHVVKDLEEVIHSAHDISPMDLVMILNTVRESGSTAIMKELTDEEMERMI
jgi:hypothetical protein